jgi:hypothetical protein
MKVKLREVEDEAEAEAAAVTGTGAGAGTEIDFIVDTKKLLAKMLVLLCSLFFVVSFL